MLTTRNPLSPSQKIHRKPRAMSTRHGIKVGDDFEYYPSDMIGQGMSSKVYKGINLQTSIPLFN